MLTPEFIYYLPGRGGRLDKGLGEGLSMRGLKVDGQATIGEFARLGLDAQRKQIAADLSTGYWHPNARVIANSYGAYLFVQAQGLLPPFPGKVLLLSPILGPASLPKMTTTFTPPGYQAFSQLLEANEWPAPKRCEIHVGENDWQCPLDGVRRFASITGVSLHVVAGAGHMLGQDYVGHVLDQWLA